MGHVLKTRVAETASLTGTGPVTLSAALTAHRRFADVCSVSDTTEYHIAAVDGSGNPTGAWEEGIGTYSSANTLTRPATPSDSSNAGSAVSFAGSVVVIMTPIAKRVGFVPRGGTVGQVVAKTGSGDFEAAWADQSVGGGGSSAAERRHEWAAPYSYAATAPAGTADSASGWTIARITVAANGSTTVAHATGAWTNRAALTYT